MRIGYARVSTIDQNLTVQLEALKTAQCDRLFQEKVSSRKTERPELARLLDQIRQGDTLIVTRLDRLARSTRQLLEILDRIKDSGAGIVSLGEPWADTTSHTGKLIMTVFAGIAEFERELTRERCAEGTRAARKNGTRFGRPPSLTTQQRKMALRLYSREEKSTGEIGRMFRCSTETVRRLIRQNRKNGRQA
jgi:DNA invertase Pin-like site-specific DNA recombinase